MPTVLAMLVAVIRRRKRKTRTRRSRGRRRKKNLQKKKKSQAKFIYSFSSITVDKQLQTWSNKHGSNAPDCLEHQRQENKGAPCVLSVHLAKHGEHKAPSTWPNTAQFNTFSYERTPRLEIRSVAHKAIAFLPTGEFAGAYAAVWIMQMTSCMLSICRMVPCLPQKREEDG